MADFKNSLSLNGTAVSLSGHTHTTTQLTDLTTSGLQLRHGFPFPYVVTLTYSAATRQITLTPSGGTFDIWNKGVKFTKTGAQTSTAHANVTGNYFIYYDASGVIQVSTTAWSINSTDIPICYVYYNATLVDGLALFELHTADRNIEWHESQHFLIGTFLRSGLEISGYTLNSDLAADVTFGLASGIIVDEDIEYNISALGDNGPYYIINRTGVSEFTWTTANTLPYKYGATYIQYNQNVANSWQLTELSSTDFVNYYVFATTAVTTAKQIFLIPGQSIHTSLSSAKSENVASLNWGTFAITEMTALWKLTFQAQSTYTGVTGRARLIEVSKLTNTKSQLTGNFSLGDHSTLSGRDVADSHPASAITYAPAGNIVATNIQTAINELDTEKLAKAGDTLTGQLISTSTYNAANNGGNIFLNSAIGNRIDFANVGVAAPAYTTRSDGTKLVLYSCVSGVAVDYAFGIEDNCLWSSVPNSASMFKWYAGTTNIATLSGAGNLTLNVSTGYIQSEIHKVGGNGILKVADELSSPTDSRILIGNGSAGYGALRLVANSTTCYSIDAVAFDNSATVKNLLINPNGGSVGIGTGTTVSAKVHSLATTEQLRLGYDVTKYCTFTVNSSGNMTVVPSGGSLSITGTLYATAKSFKIDHPSKENYYLQYGSLESPYHGIRLTGENIIKKGISIIQLPEYIKNLIKEEGINIQITNYGHSEILYVNQIKLEKNEFIICCDNIFKDDLKFFWSFTAIRKDVDKLQVEIIK